MAGGVAGAGRLFRFDPANPLSEVGTVATTASGFSLTLPARSASLVVLGLDVMIFTDGFESGNVSKWSPAVP